jgi:hypothetical protein
MSVVMTDEEKRMRAVARTYGFQVEGSADCATDIEICSAEACFLYDKEEDKVYVILWSGAWPFATDHDMGSLPDIEQAASFASWLLKREALYTERDEAALEASPCYKGTPGCQHKDIDHDACEGY